MFQALLLNSSFEGISFVSERKVFKYLAKDKVEILETWPEKVRFGEQTINYPAIIKLKYRVKWAYKKPRFHRWGVFLRDGKTCGYCGLRFSEKELTIDHVVPKVAGGKASWLNSITACTICNRRKGGRTPEEANMPLLKIPVVPILTIAHSFRLMENPHSAWAEYISS